MVYSVIEGLMLRVILYCPLQVLMYLCLFAIIYCDTV